jgi:hypothetical protein
MIRTKLGLLGLCAVVFGVMAMSASSAQAALSWLVLNSANNEAKELKAELIGEKDSADLTLLAKTLGLPLIMTCTNVALKGVNLESGGTLTTGGKVVFTGCETYESGTLTSPLECHVHTGTGAARTPDGTIETNELKGGLVLHTLTGGGSEVLTRIEPKTAGGPFVTILTEKCSWPTTNTISGVLFLKDCEKLATTHAVKHLLTQGPLTSLVYGAHSVEHLETSLDGSIWVKLGGVHASLKWAAMDA